MTHLDPVPAKVPPPETLSQLIRLAVKDARRLEPEKYQPLYLVWHKPQDVAAGWKQCKVCLAGALIARTLEAPRSAKVNPETPGYEPWRDALEALDWVRRGDYRRALKVLWKADIDGIIPPDYWQRYPPPVEPDFTNWTQFRAHLDSQEANAFRLSLDGL